jgi:acyl-CoA thioesterase
MLLSKLACQRLLKVSNINIQKLRDGTYSAVLSKSWDVWGPNGGYLCALMMMAVGEEAQGNVPVSYMGQYLRSPRYDEVEINVDCIKQGKLTSAFDVSMVQDGKIMARAAVWVGLPRNTTMDYQLRYQSDNFISLQDAVGRPPVGPMPMWDNLEIRKVTNHGGHYSHWYRFIQDIDLTNPFADAARSLILIDTMQWPARYFMEKTPPEYVAPSLDLYVQFHQFNSASQWLFSEASTNIARHGLVAGSATVWDEEGQLLASGGSQSTLIRL